MRVLTTKLMYIKQSGWREMTEPLRCTGDGDDDLLELFEISNEVLVELISHIAIWYS